MNVRTTLQSVYPDYEQSIAKKDTAADLARKPKQIGHVHACPCHMARHLFALRKRRGYNAPMSGF